MNSPFIKIVIYNEIYISICTTLTYKCKDIYKIINIYENIDH